MKPYAGSAPPCQNLMQPEPPRSCRALEAGHVLFDRGPNYEPSPSYLHGAQFTSKHQTIGNGPAYSEQHSGFFHADGHGGPDVKGLTHDRNSLTCRCDAGEWVATLCVAAACRSRSWRMTISDAGVSGGVSLSLFPRSVRAVSFRAGSGHHHPPKTSPR